MKEPWKAYDPNVFLHGKARNLPTGGGGPRDSK